MRIGVISDLHIDLNSQIAKVDARTFANALVNAFQRFTEIGTFVIAGDISSNIRHIEILFELFKKNNLESIYWVPGNHDIWVGEIPDKNLFYKDQNITSWDKYEVLFKRLSQKYYVNYLPKEPKIIDDIGFAGSLGWYDYSFRNESHDISLVNYRNKTLDGAGSWQDRDFAVWEIPDSAVARKMENDLRSDINELIEKGIRKIVAITHHIPYQEAVTYKGEIKRDYFCAFMGSKRLGVVIDDFGDKIAHVCFGHTHKKLITTIHAKKCICSPFGYFNEDRPLPKNITEDVLTEMISGAITSFQI